MAIVSKFPRKNYIPVAEVKLSDSDYDVVKVRDHMRAEYNEIFDRIGSDYTEYVVDASVEARIDLIAYQVYGDSDLWWIIGYFNGIVNPIFDLTIGKRLKIPTRETVEFLLQSNKKTLNPRAVDIP